MARGAVARFGAGCVLDRGLTVECRGRIDVGDRTVFGHHCTLAASELVQIGSDCLIAETLSAHIAADTSGFFTANVPPNPQHVSASGRSTRSMPPTARSSRSGESPTCIIRREWQVGW